MNIDPKEPAFPSIEVSDGMNIRTYIATQIVASLNARGEYGYSNYKGNAQYAVEQADWLIDALNNTTPFSSVNK